MLPPYTSARSNRNVYAVQAIDNAPYASLTQASTILIKEDYKLHYYFGYPEAPDGEIIKLFNIKLDPEELENLYTTRTGIALELLDELKRTLAEVDKPYL